MTVGHYESALKYYMILEEDADKYNVSKVKYTDGIFFQNESCKAEYFLMLKHY